MTDNKPPKRDFQFYQDLAREALPNHLLTISEACRLEEALSGQPERTDGQARPIDYWARLQSALAANSNSYLYTGQSSPDTPGFAIPGPSAADYKWFDSMLKNPPTKPGQKK